jgi:hypothetical protein
MRDAPPTTHRFWFKGDANAGAGYGTLKKKFSGGEYSTVGTFPYIQDEPELEDEELEDVMHSREFVNKTGYTGVAKARTHVRKDNASFTKMRWSTPLEESSIMKGITPFPASMLYKKFDGPAVGGAGVNQSFTNAPGRAVGTQYGTTRASKLEDDDLITIDRLHDLMDPATRNLVKQRLKIKIVQDS